MWNPKTQSVRSQQTLPVIEKFYAIVGLSRLTCLFRNFVLIDKSRIEKKKICSLWNEQKVSSVSPAEVSQNRKFQLDLIKFRETKTYNYERLRARVKCAGSRWFHASLITKEKVSHQNFDHYHDNFNFRHH